MYQLRVSPPVLRPDGRWHAKAALPTADGYVTIHVTAPRGAANEALRAIRQHVALAPFDMIGGAPPCLGCGAPRCGPLVIGASEMGADDEMGGIFDDIMNTVKSVADSPFIKAAASVIPYGPQVLTGVNMATGLYGAISKGVPKAKKQLKKIKRDARRGVPAAKKAFAQLRDVQRADRLRVRARRGDVQAQRQIARITADANRSPQALAAAAMVRSLDGFHSPPPPPYSPPLPPELPEYELPPDPDEAEQGLVEEIAGAVAERRRLSVKDAALLAKLQAILRSAEGRR